MMLRARRAAGPLLRLADAGAAGERICGGAQPSRAVFTRGFLDFFKTWSKETAEDAEKKAKAKARLTDEMSRGYFQDISEIRKNAGKIAVASKTIIPEVAAVKFPNLALESPAGRALQLPLVASPMLDGSHGAGGTVPVVPDAALVCLSFRASSQVHSIHVFAFHLSDAN
ncbi:hypothetical protein TRIUR3_22535 [Triticum urartu]|uniref:Uncharacterized protein n=1 Tax=Triticum urartu TaxID=4572 RepID=M7ZTB8_TRIUA|nr:hypothetical protein TRIUR3_22535 [Triticum urartu]